MLQETFNAAFILRVRTAIPTGCLRPAGRALLVCRLLKGRWGFGPAWATSCQILSPIGVELGCGNPKTDNFTHFRNTGAPQGRIPCSFYDISAFAGSFMIG